MIRDEKCPVNTSCEPARGEDEMILRIVRGAVQLRCLLILKCLCWYMRAWIRSRKRQADSGWDETADPDSLTPGHSDGVLTQVTQLHARDSSRLFFHIYFINRATGICTYTAQHTSALPHFCLIRML